MSMLSRFAATGGGGDPYWNNVSFLLVGNGANGTTTNIKDSSKNSLAITIGGNTVISTAQSKFSTGSSVYFDGAGDYLSVAGTPVIDIKTGDFTLEVWVYPTVSHTNYARIFHFGPTYQANVYAFSFDNAGKLKFQAANLNGGSPMIVSSVITVNAWSYVVVTRSGSVFNMFVNGVSQGTYTDAAALSSTANQPLYIGMDPDSSATYTGYMYDSRITKGVARYTGSTMTVPTAPLPIG